MDIRQLLMEEFQQEVAKTRITIERIPQQKWNWRPHKKSLTMGELATHICNIPTWVCITIKQDDLDMSPPDGKAPRVTPADSVSEVLEQLEKNVAEALQSVQAVSENQLAAEWTLQSAGKTIIKMPRINVLRTFAMNHMIHHRAQLGLYLRLNDVAVPATYGQSADES